MLKYTSYKLTRIQWMDHEYIILVFQKETTARYVETQQVHVEDK